MNNLKFNMEKISIILEDKLGQGTSFPTESLNIKSPTFLFSICSGLEFTK